MPDLPEHHTHDVAPRWLQASASVAWRLIAVIVAGALVVTAVHELQLMFVALFLALVFTAVLRPLVNALSRFVPRSLATATGMLAGITAIAGTLTYVTFSIVTQWDDLRTQFTDGLDQILTFAQDGPLPVHVTSTQVNDTIASGQQWLQSHSGQLATQAAAHAGSAVEVLTALSLAVFCTIFLLARGSQMWAWFLGQLPNTWHTGWTGAARAGWDAFSGYTRGTALVALSDGLMAFVLLEIVRVPLAAPLAVLVFIGAFIPLVGAPVAMVTAVIVALAANGPWAAVVVGVGIAVLGQIEGHVLQPLIMGKQVSLHPVAVALAVTAGTLTAGIVGAVVAVPVVAVAWAVYSQLRTRRGTAALDGSTSPEREPAPTSDAPCAQESAA